MAAVRSHDADAFVSRPPGHARIFLLYGPDAGAVSERAATLTRYFSSQPDDEFNVVRLDAEALAKEPQLLVDEAQTVGLFGGKRCIRIDSRPKSINQAIELVLENREADYRLIIEAGDLRRDAPLRRLLERESTAALIECRSDNVQQIERLIDDQAASEGLTIAPDARQLLASLLGADRLTTRSEIDKVMLYGRTSGRIEAADVAAIAADAGVVVVDNLIHAAFTGDRAQVTKQSPRVLEEMDPGVLLTFVLRHTFVLLQICIEGGRNPEAALDRFARGLPPGKRAQMSQQLKNWTADALIQLSTEVARGTFRVRTNPKLAEALAQRTLWEITRRAVRT
jgi:DNA polymerase III subunit delta